MAKHEVEAEEERERAILVGLILPEVSHQEAKDTLDELELLADTAGAVVLGRVTQARKNVDQAYFIGQGKAAELALQVKEQKVDVVIFDDDLSPAQLRNLEEEIGCKIVDRSRLILDIFAGRAKTREAQTQVELAQLNYMLPRLTRQWTHLSRQQAGHGGTTGGIGTRGPGETQLEVDRRALRLRIRTLSKALDRIARQRAVGRKQRSSTYRTALVGYTNAGKSTLMHALSGADVLVEDRLFATLDSTTRRVYLGYNREVLLTDTVGFIRKLPHHLVASFRSTLEETVDSDLLLHVVDASHPACEEQIGSVFETLESLGIAENPMLTVFNKVDILQDPGRRAYYESEYPGSVWISALTGEGLDDLRNAIYERIEGDRTVLTLRIPQSEGKLLSEIYDCGEILSTRYESNDVILEVSLSRHHAHRLLPEGRYRVSA
ncbi:MAG: GTPase HflX [Candidatus Latescibacteria bacterium]|nr:GTPase HflX [Candidatus Latescibacterota bacterium]